MSGDREKRYSQVYYEKDADGRPTEDGVFAVEDAKQVSNRSTLHLVLQCSWLLQSTCCRRYGQSLCDTMIPSWALGCVVVCEHAVSCLVWHGKCPPGISYFEPWLQPSHSCGFLFFVYHSGRLFGMRRLFCSYVFGLGINKGNTP